MRQVRWAFLVCRSSSYLFWFPFFSHLYFFLMCFVFGFGTLSIRFFLLNFTYLKTFRLSDQIFFQLVRWPFAHIQFFWKAQNWFRMFLRRFLRFASLFLSPVLLHFSKKQYLVFLAFIAVTFYIHYFTLARYIPLARILVFLSLYSYLVLGWVFDTRNSIVNGVICLS